MPKKFCEFPPLFTGNELYYFTYNSFDILKKCFYHFINFLFGKNLPDNDKPKLVECFLHQLVHCEVGGPRVGIRDRRQNRIRHFCCQNKFLQRIETSFGNKSSLFYFQFLRTTQFLGNSHWDTATLKHRTQTDRQKGHRIQTQTDRYTKL